MSLSNGNGFVESLESRRLLSAASEIGLVDSAVLSDASIALGPIALGPTVPATAVVVNIKRTYSGSFSLDTGLSGTFTLVVRKQENRDNYASLRGTLDIVTNTEGTLHADMTYGKIRANNRINMTLVGTSPVFNVTITGKANDSGSQLKGQMDVTGSVALSTTFVISKVSHS